MRTILSITGKSIKALQGGFNGKKFSISARCVVDMPRNTFANMAVMADKRAEFLGALREVRAKLKRFSVCEILLDSPYCVTSEHGWRGDKGFIQSAKNAFMNRKEFNEKDFLTDYCILEKSTKEKPTLVLFGAVKRGDVTDLGALFREAKIEVASVDMLMSGILKLVAKSPTFDHANAIINIIDGGMLSACSFRDKGALFPARTSIAEREGTPTYYQTISNEIYKHAKYQRTYRQSIGRAEKGFLYVFDINPNVSARGYEQALKANNATDDYCGVGVRAALADSALPKSADASDIDVFAAHLGALIDK